MHRITTNTARQKRKSLWRVYSGNAIPLKTFLHLRLHHHHHPRLPVSSCPEHRTNHPSHHSSALTKQPYEVGFKPHAAPSQSSQLIPKRPRLPADKPHGRRRHDQPESQRSADARRTTLRPPLDAIATIAPHRPTAHRRRRVRRVQRPRAFPLVASAQRRDKLLRGRRDVAGP